MFTAQANFTHQIAETKEKNHKLVKSGIYACLRHPSYCGFYWWSVGTQILLMNPLW
jgi:protein-S-isoprenylcysteine O-methyltransferase